MCRLNKKRGLFGTWYEVPDIASSTHLYKGFPWFTGWYWLIRFDFTTVSCEDSGQSGLTLRLFPMETIVTSKLIDQNNSIIQWKSLIQLDADGSLMYTLLTWYPRSTFGSGEAVVSAAWSRNCRFPENSRKTKGKSTCRKHNNEHTPQTIYRTALNQYKETAWM